MKLFLLIILFLLSSCATVDNQAIYDANEQVLKIENVVREGINRTNQTLYVSRVECEAVDSKGDITTFDCDTRVVTFPDYQNKRLLLRVVANNNNHLVMQITPQ